MAGVLAFDEFEIDPARSELRRAGRPLKVDALVIDLLAHLAGRGGELVTHEELIKHVWGGRAVSDNVVSVCVAKLRKALGHRRGERELIVNVYGRGYRFLPAVRELTRVSEPPVVPVREAHAGAPFVGRDAIMARLSTALAAARERHGSVCALIGEPGIGKTRIAEALEQRASVEGMRVAWGRARELEGAPPFWPWAELLRTVLSSTSIESAASLLGTSFAELSRVLPELRAVAHADAVSDDAARYRTFDAIARLLSLAGERGPWLLVLDDMHRADAASLELLCYLVDGIARLPITLAVTLRRTEPRLCPTEQRHIEYVLGHRNCARIEVAPLSERDVAACTAALLGRSDEALALAVFQRSEGNAFFVTELLREVGEARGAGDRELPPFPTAALDLVRQRIRRVGEEALGYLKIAAVLGRSFELGLLSRVSKVPAAVLLESFDHVLATELIVAPDGFARYAFGHELIRTVLYDGLPKLERAALHLRVAHVLEELEQGGREVAPAELAHHYLCALPHGEPMRAAEHGERAAAAAMSAAAYADAAAILRRAQAALDLAVDSAPHLRCRLHFRMSVCLRVSDARASIAELRRAVALARATSLYPLLAVAGQAMVRAPGVVMIEDGRAVLEDALAGLSEDEHGLRSTTLSHLAWCAPYCFDREKTEELGARALEHARLARSRPALITALRTQIHFSGGPCRPHEEIKRLLDEADQLAATEGHAMRVTWSNQASTLRATFALQRGDRRGVERALDTLSRTARQLQHSELIWHSDRIRIIDRMNRGELRDTAEQLRELRTRAKGLSLFAHEQVCSHDVMVLRRQTVGLDEAKFALSSLAHPAPQDSPSVLGIKLRAAVDAGRHDNVRVVFGEFVQRGLTRLPCDRDHLGVLGHLALAALMLDDRDHVQLLFELLAPHSALFASDLSFHSDGSVAHVVGLLARHLGRRDAALAYLNDAVWSNERFGLRARAAESRCELASTLMSGTLHDKAVARELLTAVQSAAYTMGMAPLLGRATALLSHSGSSLDSVHAVR